MAEDMDVGIVVPERSLPSIIAITIVMFFFIIRHIPSLENVMITMTSLKYIRRLTSSVVSTTIFEMLFVKGLEDVVVVVAVFLVSFYFIFLFFFKY